MAKMEVGERKLLDNMVIRLPVRLSNLHLTSTALICQIGIYTRIPTRGKSSTS